MTGHVTGVVIMIFIGDGAIMIFIEAPKIHNKVIECQTWLVTVSLSHDHSYVSHDHASRVT